MCGITGAVWTDQDRSIDAQTLRRMTDVLAHRGPDDAGEYCAELQILREGVLPGVALGFRRLSIIDLETGRQPMSNEDGTVWVIFNGEIYNYPDLRHRLEGAGHVFRTQSDTETIVHLYEDEGLDTFQHLNGMFAIAIWDAVRRRLVLGRDRLGQKPLVYCKQTDRLLFASELKSILQAPDVPRDVDPGAIDEYLTYQYVPHPHTIFRGINKLPPGHFAVHQHGELSVRPYWQPQLDVEQSISVAQASPRLCELFHSSVTMRMRSDVPLGAFLSGGVDSSLVAAVMQKHSERPIKTFSIGFPVKEYDETSYARLVAERLGTEHHEFQVTPDGLEVLPKLIWHYDEPFADSSAVPTWYVSKLTREHVTVALSGDGGDELFAGYPRYKAVDLAHRLDRNLLVKSVFGSRVWSRIPGGGRQKSFTRRLKRFSQALNSPPQRRYLNWIGIFDEASRAEIYTDDFLQSLPARDPFDFLGAAWARAGERDSVTAASLADLTTYLPCDLMTKVDIASMAHGLECRQPFLDYRLVEWAASLPLALKYRHGKGKRLLRWALGDLLPDEIWTRPKMGFGVPIGHWFRHELREMTHDVLLDESARSRNYFQPASVARLVEEHDSGAFDHSYRLWALLVLELWLREWAEDRAANRSELSLGIR